MKIVEHIFMTGFIAAMCAAFLSVPLRSWFVLAAVCCASVLVASGFSRRRLGGVKSDAGTGSDLPTTLVEDHPAATAGLLEPAAGERREQENERTERRTARHENLAADTSRSSRPYRLHHSTPHWGIFNGLRAKPIGLTPEGPPPPRPL